MKILKFTPVVLFSALTFATQSEFKYYDPNTWNMSIPENILQYFDTLDAIDPSIVFRNTSALDDQQCNNDFLSIFHDLRENQQWPKVMLDAGNSFQHGILEGNRLAMGNYDECLSVNPPNRNFTAKYCLAYINDSIDPFTMKDYGFYWFRRPILYLALCIPSTCSEEYLDRVVNEFRFPNSNETISDAFGVGVDDCYTNNDSKELTTLNWTAIAVVATLAACMALSSFYGIWCKYTKNDKPSKLFLAFSVPHNLSEILNTTASTRLSALSGIRAITAIYIVYGHCFYLELNGTIQNWRFAMVGMNGSLYGANIINHGTTAVDSFFVLTGLFLATSFLTDISKRSHYDPAVAFIKRYLRMMIPVAFLLLVTMGLTELLFTGPIFKAMYRFFRKGCKGYFWSNLLLYNNFLQDTTEMCIQHLWYVYVDLQLTLATQLLFIYGLYNIKRCAQVSLILCWGATVIEFTIAYIFDMGVTPSYDKGNIFKLDYSMPYSRAGPWAAGIFLGFLLQHIMSKGIKPTKAQAIMGWFLCAIFLFASIYPLQFFTVFDYEQPWAALYFSFRRLTWSISICLMIILCATSRGGYLAELLEWRPLKLFDNITMELYLVHIPCLEFFIASEKSTFYVSLGRGFYNFCAILPLSSVIAILLSLMVTKPCNVIIRQLVPMLKIMPLKHHWKVEKDGTKEALA